MVTASITYQQSAMLTLTRPDRRAAIIESITAQGKLTPELAASLDAADTKARLEDLYLPYKPKRRTICRGSESP